MPMEVIFLNWWGKLLGSALGFMTGGPLGAMLGLAAGHAADARFRPNADGRQAPRLRQGVGLVFVQSCFQVMGYLAKADGRVSEKEIAAARAVMDRLRFNPDQRQAAIHYFQEGKRADFDLETTLSRFHAQCQDYPNLIEQFMDMQLRMIYADDLPSPPVRAQLHRMAHQLGFPRTSLEFQEALLRARHRRRSQSSRAGAHHDRQEPTRTDPLTQAYATLGLNREASVAEVKTTYRRLISQYHPDKLTAQGLPSQVLEQATDKAREINTAYERIRESRGF